MTDLKDELAEYIGVLSEGAARTSRSEDRAVYMQHLAAAAHMFFLLQKDVHQSALANWVADERRAYGWGYLAEEVGREAEAAFQRFAEVVEKAVVTH